MKKFLLLLSLVTFSSFGHASNHFCRNIEVYDSENQKHHLNLCADTKFDGENLVDVLSNVTLNGLPVQIGNRTRDLLTNICKTMYNRSDDLASSRSEKAYSQAMKLEINKGTLIYDLEEAKNNKNLKTIKIVECQAFEYYML